MRERSWGCGWEVARVQVQLWREREGDCRKLERRDDPERPREPPPPPAGAGGPLVPSSRKWRCLAPLPRDAEHEAASETVALPVEPSATCAALASGRNGARTSRGWEAATRERGGFCALLCLYSSWASGLEEAREDGVANELMPWLCSTASSTWTCGRRAWEGRKMSHSTERRQSIWMSEASWLSIRRSWKLAADELWMSGEGQRMGKRRRRSVLMQEVKVE